MTEPGWTEIEHLASGCEHWSGNPDDRVVESEAPALSEGFCPYCHTPVEPSDLGTWCRCCKWHWMSDKGSGMPS